MNDLENRLQSEVDVLKHHLAGDYDKWQIYTSENFYTKVWTSIKRIKEINGKLYIPLDIEKDIMRLSSGMLLEIRVRHISEVKN